MAITFHPDPGTILVCDFSGFKQPEMTKRRPVVVLSPRFRQREGLCTIVPLSTTRPKSICNFHCLIDFDPVLPEPYNEPKMWLKGDMMVAVSFSRLSLQCVGKDKKGNRIYDIRHLSDENMKRVKACVLHGLGLSELTSHL